MRATQCLALLIVLACSDDERAHIERSEYTDSGSLCVSTGARGELYVSAIVNGCGSGCASVVDSTCDIDVDNTELVVHSSIHVEQLRGPDIACPAACVPISAHCAPLQVSPGDYVLRHGGNISAVRLPTDMPVLLGGDGIGAAGACGLL